jgi:thiamine pyrophosphokinase
VISKADNLYLDAQNMGKKITKDQLRIANLFESRPGSVKEFCEAHEVKYHNVRYWLKKIKEEPSKENKSFVPITFNNVSAHGWLEIRTAKGIVLTINEPVSADFIKSLLN